MCADKNSAFQDGISFGPFRLFPGRRLVERDGVPLRIGSRSLDILIVLVERAGEVVSKAELMSRVWPKTVVDESGLRVHLAGLRRSISDGLDGARYIANVTGRGYCFVAPVERHGTPSDVATEETASNPLARLPAPPRRMVGREETVRRLTSQLLSERFLTIVGPGGIGKTTVAVSVAHALLPEFEGAVFFVDLGTVTDSDLIARSIASTLGYKGHGGDPAPALVAFLARKRALIVLDNCEHVIDAVAPLTERILIEAPRVHVLATSREALRAKDERVHQLAPLDSPVEIHGLTAAKAKEFPAVQLFVERAAVSDSSFTITDADASIIAGICGRLDGIALAIELAASRVGTHGIRGIAGLLDNRFRLSWKGRRTALPRHRTLNGLLDWSHNLLQDEERLVLRRLSIFVGSFTRDAVEAIACDHDLTSAQGMDALEGLLEKSLISTRTGEDETRYRLLETTRAYAYEKLTVSGEGGLIARRHAAYFAQEARRAALEGGGATRFRQAAG
jgi:predicted ATPase/DNA-binding winged helix-turn-helix (wHTH) protein